MSTIGKQITCRAAVLWKEGQPLTVETITVDPPQEGEVRVRMVAAGICASDAHIIWGYKTDFELELEGNPIVLGHEGAGIIESVGPGVTSVAPGDKVILMWSPDCGKCPLCAHPKVNYCTVGTIATLLYHNNRETRMKVNGKPLLAMGGVSTFSQYSVVRESQLAKVDQKVDLKTDCIVGCAVGTGYGSAINIAQVHEGSTCAVWGLGAIGLSTVLGCKAAKAKTIIGIDINPDKEAIARQMGCTRFINSKTLDNPLEEVLSGADALDYAFDCIGNQEVIKTALKCLYPWGVLTLIGLPPRGSRVDITAKEIMDGRQVVGGYFGRGKPRKTIQELVDLHLSGELAIEPMISHRMPLDAINEAFDGLKAGKTIRTVIEY